MEAQTTSERKPTLKERLTTVASALQHRNYRLYFTGLLFSITGFQMLLVIQGWLIWDITGDPKALAYLGGVTAVPTVLLNLYGGVIADRFDQRLLIMLVSTAICLLLLVMATLVTLEMANLWNLLLLAFLIAGAQAFDNPARQALYPHLIARKDLMNAVALNSIVWQGTRVVGPLIAGLLIAGVGAGPALYIAAAGFAFMVVAMTAIRVPPIARAAGGSMVQNLVEGIGYVVKNQVFAVLIGLTFLNSFFGMSFIILLPIFATDILNVGPEGLGEMHAVGGVGAIVMALVAAAMSKSRNKGLVARRRGRPLWRDRGIVRAVHQLHALAGSAVRWRRGGHVLHGHGADLAAGPRAGPASRPRVQHLQPHVEPAAPGRTAGRARRRLGEPAVRRSPRRRGGRNSGRLRAATATGAHRRHHHAAGPRPRLRLSVRVFSTPFLAFPERSFV